MSSVFYRSPGHPYPRGARGEGVYLYDDTGKQYLDGSGGAAVTCLGHGHPDVIAAIKTQVDELAYAHTSFFTNEPQEKLAARLAERFGEENARIYFLSGGSEANETAVKLARQYWLARGKPDKHIVISREQSYHGNTLGALSLSGNPVRRDIFGPCLHDWPRIAPCYAYRHQQDDETDDEYGERAARALEEAIVDNGADTIAAFIAETVVGATLGAVPPTGPYLKRIREICDRHDVLLILDEVMAGSGRTGTYFAFEQDGVRPDITTIAKGLGGGYQPIAATIVRSFVHDAIVDAFKIFEHGHTYIGHATACAAAMAVSDVIDRDDLLTHVGNIGEELFGELKIAFGDHPNVGNIRGRGLFIGIELVADRDTKKPIDRNYGGRLKGAGMDKGLIIYPGGRTADGEQGAHILLAPPFIYEPKHVEELVSKLQVVVKEVGLG
ncbi:MAG: aspartate aminotransferase family protein [Woeseiaceae bacterium]|nr:aspartate aminotransferase family protein [Woeseiaceae bacterium]NIP20296.1 aspartate aminotransferase family protein [Woeseiaceae bacterium]NIS89169.1 aspartate aminotransferase family protein [Woeseiaceae bacterium]